MKQYVDLNTGEIITIKNTDGLYVTLSNNETVTYENFISNYKQI